MASPEYEKQSELLWLQTSPLVTLLHEVADQHHRQDGWTYLAHAGNLAARELPDEFIEIELRYGFKILKMLLVAAETFDVLDEQLASGGFRTLYRSKQLS